MKNSPWTFCVAPMMGWTDRHFRSLFRLGTRHARLYTEMITTGALLHGDTARFLQHDPSEHPLALQLGGHEPAALAECARIGEAAGYQEINLNVGCPSDRASSGTFGACLMAQPQRVADCVAAMRRAVQIPVTVKTRIGIDELDSDEYFESFLLKMHEAGADALIIHARKAWLSGLSPKENRTIPPLNVERVLRFKQKYPEIQLVLNGGLSDMDSCREALKTFEGVMVGRAAYHTPLRFREVDSLWGTPIVMESAYEWIRAFLPYLEREFQQGVPLRQMVAHLMHWSTGLPGGRQFRRALSETLRLEPKIEVVREAVQNLESKNSLKTEDYHCVD